MSPDLDSVPINRKLAFRLVAQAEDRAEIILPIQPWFEQEGGVIHGGIITTLADTCAVYAIHPAPDTGLSMTSIELKVNFLRPGRMDGESLLARASAVRRGRTIGVCDVEVLQGSEMIAKGLFTYLFR